jgi:hypothetical protein
MLGTKNELPGYSLQTLSPEDNSKVPEYSDQGSGSGLDPDSIWSVDPNPGGQK